MIKSNNWYKGDKTSGYKLEIMNSHYELTQIINKAIPILEDCLSEIDPVFTYQ